MKVKKIFLNLKVKTFRDFNLKVKKTENFSPKPKSENFQGEIFDLKVEKVKNFQRNYLESEKFFSKFSYS